ncbi:MAG: HipA family kinase [Lapillicoccus sp.]
MTDGRGGPALERVTATRYVTPLREGGSLPGLVEADDDGIYVLKFRGAGQGVKVLVAEILVTEIARLLGIPVPRLALVTLDAQIAKYEADEEVQDLLNASIGLNLGVDFLPGSFGYDGSAPPPTVAAARIVWLDALTANVDRTWNNPNLLLWHRRTWAIDHGAALYFHHGWPSRAPDPVRFSGQDFDASTHVLREVAGDPAASHDELAATLTPAVLASVVELVPEEWLETTPWLPDATAVRSAYLEMLLARLANPGGWLPAVAS